MDSRTALLNASRPRRRLAAAALLALVAVLLAAIGFGLQAGLDARMLTLEAKHAELARLRSMIAMAPDGAGAPEGLETGPGFLAGDNPALAQAAFQKRLRAIAATSGAELMTVENAPLVERDGATFAGLRASLVGSNDELLQTIFLIETAEPYLMIRSARIGPAKTETAAENGPPELLMQVHFEGALAPG
jgi:hypothetical protein